MIQLNSKRHFPLFKNVTTTFFQKNIRDDVTILFFLYQRDKRVEKHEGL